MKRQNEDFQTWCAVRPGTVTMKDTTSSAKSTGFIGKSLMYTITGPDVLDAKKKDGETIVD